MSIYNPTPSGNDAETEHHREIYRQTNKAIPLRSSSAVKVQRTTTGTFLRMRRTPPGGSSSSSGFNYRGLWTATPPTPYMILDVVLLGAGTSAGMYLSTIKNNANLPDSGIGWTQISSFATWL